MAKRMMIDAIHEAETRVVIAENNKIVDFDFTTLTKKQLKGNIYLAKITRVEPSLQAAFVEYGGNKQGFLPFSEIHPDYYQIPISDRKRLMKEAEDETDDDDDNQAEEATTENKEQPEPKDEPKEEAAEAKEPVKQEAAPEEAATSEPIADDGKEANAEHPAEATTANAETDEKSPPQKDKDENSGDVETLPSEEEEMQRRKRKKFFRRYKIQEVIRRGQVVLVQVIKEERGNKGVSLTTYLSLAGRYCVLMPNSPKDGGISRKISSSDDRKRLKAISHELRLAEGMSVIIRTAGMDRTRAEIKRDYDYLVKMWNTIRDATLQATAPSLVYEESDVIKRAIRDQYTSDIDEIVIEGDEGYKAARDFMKLLLPSHTPKIKHYKDSVPMFYAYDIEDQLLSMHDPVAKLKSGGYIVMNPTEALISIDVNSGRATSERNIEETATKTNLEAAAEIARQLRLRDLAGLIVIDFIDMNEARNRRAVERALKDALKMDRAKIQLGRISPFGLLEMSRQRLRPSISETSMVQCNHCIGRGFVRSNESMSIQMIRALEKEASTGDWNGLRLILPQAVALHLLNTKRDMLKNIEQTHDLAIQILIDSDMGTSDFNLEKMRRSPADRKQDRKDSPRKRRGRAASKKEAEDKTETDSVEEDGDNKRGKSRRGRRASTRRKEVVTDADDTTNEAESDKEEEKAEKPAAKKPSRGRKKAPQSREKDEDDAPKNSKANDNTPSDASKLPSFATEEIKQPAPNQPDAPEKVAAVHALPATPRDPSQPARKGWWQKMIELDD